MLTGVLWRIFQADKFYGCKKIVLAETIKLIDVLISRRLFQEIKRCMVIR